jgi:hypothetical protein
MFFSIGGLLVMNKKFDCVEMKHRAARIIQRKLSKLTREEELEYWKAQSKALREEQKKTIKKVASKV